jgi:exosortase/archaeosortase family protein
MKPARSSGLPGFIQTPPIIVSFLVRFFLIFIGVELALAIFPLYAYQSGLTESLGRVFSLPVNGTFLFFQDGTVFEISAFCTGFTSAALFAGLLYGFSSIPKNKTKYLIEGTVLLLLLNYIRLLVIIWVGQTVSISAAYWAHALSWFVLSGIAFGAWLLILRRETGGTTLQELGRRLMQVPR